MRSVIANANATAEVPFPVEPFYFGIAQICAGVVVFDEQRDVVLMGLPVEEVCCDEQLAPCLIWGRPDGLITPLAPRRCSREATRFSRLRICALSTSAKEKLAKATNKVAADNRYLWFIIIQGSEGDKKT